MANLSNINGKFVVEQTTGYVGVGTTDPNYSIEVLNASAEIALNASGGSIYRVQSDSASNFIIRKEGVGDRLVINSAGNSTFSGSVTAVGISSTTQTTTSGYFATSTTIPGNQIVHVRDNVATTLVSSAGGIKISSSPGNDVFLLKRWDHSASSSYFALQNSSAAEFITVNMASGNVGIGTTTPGNSILSIHFDDSYGAYGPGKGVNVTNETTTGAAGFVQLSARYNNTSPAQTFYQVGGMGGGKETALGNNEWGGYLSFWTTSDGTAGAASGMFEHMRITADGNVGIGTASPLSTLQLGDYFTIAKGDADYMGAIGFNRSAGTGAIFNSAFSAQQIHNYQGKLTVQTYNGTGSNISPNSLVVDETGNVGIGTASPQTKLQTNLTITGAYLAYLNGTSATFDAASNIAVVHNSPSIGSATAAGLVLANNDKSNGAPSPIIAFSAKSASNTYNHTYAAIYGIRTASGSDTNWTKGDIILATGSGTGPNQRMRITSVGNVLIGDFASNGSIDPAQSGFGFQGNGLGTASCNFSDTNEMFVFNQRDGQGTTQIDFRNGNVERGKIQWTTSGTTYNTTSDYRVKENLKDFNGLDKVSKIKVYDFHWIESKKQDYGVIAHELQEILPLAVTGEKDGEKMQGVDYSKIVPLLVKSIQELKANNDILKAEIELLKNK